MFALYPCLEHEGKEAMNFSLASAIRLDVAVLSLALMGSCLYCVVLQFRLHRRRLEGCRLVESVKQLLQPRPASVDAVFAERDMQRLWNFFKLTRLNANVQTNVTSQTYNEAIHLTEELAKVSHEKNLTSQKLVEVLSNVGPEIKAVAVVLKNARSNALEIESVFGVPARRVEEALLVLFDARFDPVCSSSERAWGYVNPNRGDLEDFSAFDIGMSLLVPLEGVVGLMGGVWLGFRKGSGTLTPERKTFVKAVAQHAAASFYAAQAALEKTTATKRERDIILGMSHDLRTPGNTALYCVTSLLDGARGPLSDAQLADLRVIERALYSQFSIFEDLFDFAKYQNGMLRPQPACFLLSKILVSVVSDFRRAFELRNIEFLCDKIPEECVRVDKRHFQRILLNLLSNAEKYTDAGSVKVQFSLRPDFVEIHICDTGIGIPSAVKKQDLFQQFQRFENARGKQGVGVGLAITKALACANEGFLDYRPNFPRGSIFTVGLRRGAFSEVVDSSSSVGAVVEKRIALPTIVIADDDEGIRNTFARYAAGVAKNVVRVSNLADLRELISRDGIDLMISDVEFSDGSVIEMLEEGIVKCKVILVSGITDLVERYPHLVSLGVMALEKPLSREVLLDAIARVRDGGM